MKSKSLLPFSSAGLLNRRSLLQGLGAAAAVALPASTMLAAEAEPTLESDNRPLNRGDAAILKLLAAAEIVEADLWQQYTELGGQESSRTNYRRALEFLDDDGPQYITSNTLDEVSHVEFLNAYLESKGEEPVNFDRFRNLPGSQATGAKNIGRLTNLMKLTVDTSWFVRYRSKRNPDFVGNNFQQAIDIVNRPAIPRTDADLDNADHIQAIANTAAFHFGFIEQTGTSLYATLSQKVSSLEVLKITLGIGGDEIAHFLEWMDFAGNAVKGPPYSFANAPNPVSDNGLTFFDFEKRHNRLLNPDLIFPIPCEFISPNLPLCAVIRPMNHGQIDARGAIQGAIDDGLFIGQPEEFPRLLLEMADGADAAKREL